MAEARRVLPEGEAKINQPILLVEQSVRMALKLFQRAYILEVGSLAPEDNSCDLVDNEMVKGAYLGG